MFKNSVAAMKMKARLWARKEYHDNGISIKLKLQKLL
jgi:hypothetical protein